MGIAAVLYIGMHSHSGVVHTCKTAGVPFLRYLEAERKRCITPFVSWRD